MHAVMNDMATKLCTNSHKKSYDNIVPENDLSVYNLQMKTYPCPAVAEFKTVSEM